MLYRGSSLKELLDRLRPKVESENRRIVAKGRQLSIQMDQYIEAQASKEVRASIRRLVGDKQWRFVRFEQFIASLSRLFDQLLGATSNSSSPVCFVVDGDRKSSFWVVVLCLLMRFDAKTFCVCVDDNDDDPSEDVGGGGLRRMFKTLPKDTRLVLMDDATYSGDQLTSFYDVVVEAWKIAHRSSARPLVHVTVPFMSTSSIALFRMHGLPVKRLHYAEKFNTIFYKRSIASIISSDIFFDAGSGSSSPSSSSRVAGTGTGTGFERSKSSGVMADYRSLYFDVLSLRPTNSMFVFEHKVADSLSIPNLWLKAGPCAPSRRGMVAYRIKADRATQLAGEIRADLRRRGAFAWALSSFTSSQRLLFGTVQRILGLMHSPKFRSEYTERVSMAPDPGHAPSPESMPLIPIEFCDPQYRRWIAGQKLRNIPETENDNESKPCRRPPYKRNSFRRRLV